MTVLRGLLTRGIAGLSVLAKNTAAAVPYLPRRGRAGLRNMAAHGEREDLRQMARHEDGCGSSLLLFLGVYRRGRRDLLIRARVVVLYSCHVPATCYGGSGTAYSRCLLYKTLFHPINISPCAFSLLLPGKCYSAQPWSSDVSIHPYLIVVESDLHFPTLRSCRPLPITATRAPRI